MKYRIKIDGGAQPNPGEAAAGAVVFTDQNPQAIFAKAKYLGPNITNNVAEHEALILALKIAIAMGIQSVRIESDSKVVVNHFNGDWNVHDETLKGLIVIERRLASKIKNLTVEWVGREGVQEAHNVVQSEIEYQLKIKGIHGKGKGKERIFADVSKFLADNSVHVIHKTDIAFFVPGCAIIPIWDFHMFDGIAYPRIEEELQKDANLLNEEIPVIVAWRPYGQNEKPVKGNRLPVKRELHMWPDGGPELLTAYWDYGLISYVLQPARELAWWKFGEQILKGVV